MHAHIIATLMTLGLGLQQRYRTALDGDRERGLTTLEIVFWSAGLLLVAGLVFAAIQAYVAGKIPGIS
ncbi:MAG: hypothetical protein ACYCTH_00085 [Cellulomonas sp.]